MSVSDHLPRAERRRRERAATRRVKAAIPRPETRAGIQRATEALDAMWARGCPVSLGAVAVEHAGLYLITIAPCDQLAADLATKAPSLARYAASLERLRILAATDGWVMVVPEAGTPEGVVVGRPGRYLADEGLEGLVDLAASDQPIGSGGAA